MDFTTAAQQHREAMARVRALAAEAGALDHEDPRGDALLAEASRLLAQADADWTAYLAGQNRLAEGFLAAMAKA